MLMRRNVAAGIASNEQGEYCRAALQRFDRKEPRYKCPTLLLLLAISRPNIQSLTVADYFVINYLKVVGKKNLNIGLHKVSI